MPPVLVRHGTVMVVAALLVLAGLAAFVRTSRKFP
jgi:MprA protease rhombosortase-interaction domain-containing protein